MKVVATALLIGFTAITLFAQQNLQKENPYLSPIMKLCSLHKSQPCATNPQPISSATDAEDANAHHVAGTVNLWLIVGTDGRAYRIRVLQAAGHGLDELAIAAVNRWKWEPATNNGVPVAVEIMVSVKFDRK